MLNLILIQDTKKAINPSYKMRAYNIKTFIRDVRIISDEGYEFSHNFIYKNKVSLIYYSKKFNSYLNALLDEDSIEWYWVPKDLARVHNNDNWVIPRNFPTVLDSDDDDVKGLINFARVASISPITITVDEDDRMDFNGVKEWLESTLNSIKDPTIGSFFNRMDNLFGKNMNRFTVVELSPIEKSKIHEENYKNKAFSYLYSILSDVEKELVKTTYDSSVLSSQYRQDIVKQSSIPFQEQIPNTVKNTKAESSNKLLSIIGVIVLGIIGILLLIGFSNGIAHGFGIGLLLGSCKKASDLIKNKTPSK